MLSALNSVQPTFVKVVHLGYAHPYLGLDIRRNLGLDIRRTLSGRVGSTW